PRALRILAIAGPLLILAILLATAASPGPPEETVEAVPVPTAHPVQAPELAERAAPRESSVSAAIRRAEERARAARLAEAVGDPETAPLTDEDTAQQAEAPEAATDEVQRAREALERRRARARSEEHTSE